MLVLSVDSSTESASCAVLSEDKLLGEINFNYKKQHSVILMEMIDELLRNISLDISDIEGFVVSKGPGSFTGLRIGVATIKGLSSGLNRPFIGISSLDGLAYNMAYTPGIICPIIDALRGNVYTALYKFESNALIKTTDYMVISIDELISILIKENSPVTFIGDAVSLYKDKLIEEIKEVKFAPLNLNFPRASSLGELSIPLLNSGANDDLANFAPLYLRKSQAEREYDKKVGLQTNE